MDTGVLRIVGQAAGIGRLALGVFLLLFRQLLQKSIFAKLTRSQSHRLLVLFMLLAFLVALAGVGAWAYGQYLTTDRAEVTRAN